MARCTGRVPVRVDGKIKRDKSGKRVTRPCKLNAIKGGKVCNSHGGGAKQVRAKAAVRAEVMEWGLGDTTVDPGETLLRLVSQSAARAQMYSRLLEQAYDAAERLRQAHEAEDLVVDLDPVDEDGELEKPAIQRAKDDLARIFNTGGVAALIGYQMDATKDGYLYATGEQIRGLAQLEAQERDRCANFAAKAVTAGLAERQVRLAERQGELIVQVLTAVFDDIGLSDEQQEVAPDVIARHLTLIPS